MSEVLGDWRIWMMLPTFAVLSWLVAQYYMRRVFIRIAYHRSGGTVDILQCMEREDRITFVTQPDPLTKRKEEITITKAGLPEIQMAGMKTFKLWHAVEGYGRTVDIRNVKAKADASGTGSVIATSLSTMGAVFDLMQRAVGKAKSEWILIAIIGAIMFFLGLGWGKVMITLIPVFI